MASNDPSVFDHVFSGWSVWLEFENDAMEHEINRLAEHCGGADAGVRPFPPHLTMLYNFPTGNPDDQEAILKTVADSLEGSGDLTLTPTDFCFFHYPKEADDGKGFGCVISMILFDKPEWLTNLHSKVKIAFPSDERQTRFTPHLSLVYAPEAKSKWLGKYTQKVLEKERQDLLEPITPRYLSVWSTDGTTDQWHRIARVELECSQEAKDAAVER